MPTNPSRSLPAYYLPLASAPVLDERLELVKAELIRRHHLPAGKRIKIWAFENRYSIVCFVVDGPFATTTYYLSNISSPLPPWFNQITGVNNSGVNSFFNGPAIAGVLEDCTDVVSVVWRKGWRGISTNPIEVVALGLAAALDFLLSISASLPYDPSTTAGNQVLASNYTMPLNHTAQFHWTESRAICAGNYTITPDKQWNPAWVSFSNNVYILISAIVYFPALFLMLKALLSVYFHTKEQRREAYIRNNYLAEIADALVGINPDEIKRIRKNLERLDHSDYEAFIGSAITYYQERPLTKCEAFWGIGRELLAQISSFLYWFGTAGLITLAVRNNNLLPALTFFALYTGAKNFWCALFFHNLSNGLFAYRNSSRGGQVMGLLTLRVVNNYDRAPILGDCPRIPVLAPIADALYPYPVAGHVIYGIKHISLSHLAFFLMSSMIILSGGTTLAQANDSLGGIPFTLAPWMINTVNFGSGINAMMVNSGEAAMPLYLMFLALITMLLSLAVSCCRSAPAPAYEPTQAESEGFIIAQYRNLFKARDPESFDEAKTAILFFNAADEAAPGYHPPSSGGAGSVVAMP